MNKERAASLIFLSSGIYGLIFGLQLPLGHLREPGPGMLPLCLSILLCLSGIVWLIYARKKGMADREQRRADWQETLKKFVTPLKIIGVTAAYILTMTKIGFLLGSLLYLLLLFFWISRYKVWIAVGLSLLIGVGSWYFFGKILAIQLPKGILSL